MPWVCSPCTPNAYSSLGGTNVSSCRCNVGFDIGDGLTTQVQSEEERCTISLEVRIATFSVGTGRNVSDSICFSNISSCIPNASVAYCDRNASTAGDVWLRIQWNNTVWTDWYAFPAAGASSWLNPAVLFITGLNSVGGTPQVVEMYLPDEDDDAWRPCRIQVRFPRGLNMTAAGYGFLTNSWYQTTEPICWVGPSTASGYQLNVPGVPEIPCAAVTRTGSGILVSS